MPGNSNDTQGNKSPFTNGQQKQSGLSWSIPAAPAPVRPASPMQSSVPTTPDVQKNFAQVRPQQAVPAATSKPADKGKLIKLLVGGVVVGGLLMWAWLATQDGSPTNNTGIVTRSGSEIPGSQTQDSPNTTSSNSNTSASGIAGLTVSSLQNAGLEVELSNVSVSQPTWIVVYESRGGEPGNALGAALVFPENKNGTVRLLRTTLAGQTYFVGQSIDNGDRTFSLQEDEPVRDVQGNLVLTTFNTR